MAWNLFGQRGASSAASAEAPQRVSHGYPCPVCKWVECVDKAEIIALEIGRPWASTSRGRMVACALCGQIYAVSAVDGVYIPEFAAGTSAPRPEARPAGETGGEPPPTIVERMRRRAR